MGGGRHVDRGEDRTGEMFIALSTDTRDVIEFEIDAHGFALRYPVAYCAETDRLVSVVARMAPALDSRIAQGYFYEFSFEVALDSMDGSFESFATQKGEIAKPFIPHEIRGAVLGWVRDGYIRLIQEFSPETIYRVTSARNLNDKTMLKHDILTSDIENQGYSTVKSGLDPFGRRFWVQKRVRD